MFNAQSIVNKVDNVLRTLTDKSVDLAGICETWITEECNETTARIKSYGYSIFHSFRKDRRGGGAALLYKMCYKLIPFEAPKSFKSFEYTAASLKTATGTNVMFVIVYRPGVMTSMFNIEIDQLFSEIQPKADCIILAGDLNIHFDQLNNRLYKQAFEILQSYGLQRNVFESTHIGGGSLDQIFTFSLKNQLNCEVDIDSTRALSSDHFPVYCNLSLTFEKKYFKEVTYHKLGDVDNDLFVSDLNCIINNLKIDSHSFHDSVKRLTSDCHKLITNHAPLITRKIPVIETAPWFDKGYRQLRQLRRKAERRLKKPDCTIDDRIAFKDACKACTIMANSKKREYFKNVMEKSQGNPRTLYKMVNKALDRKQDKPLPTYTDDVKKLTNDFNLYFSEKVEKIRQNMSSPSNVDFESEIPQMRQMHEFRPTDIDEIKQIINETGIKCSPDDILPHRALKDHISTLLPTLVELVNVSLTTGNVNGVKLADIIPNLKSDSLDPNALKNFRPISNLTFLGKLIERVVLKQLNEHLAHNNLNCDEQSAYKKHNSTETILIRIWNDLLIASDEKSATIVMMLDLSAAFDTVDHDLLIKILRHEIGLGGKVLQWFTSFLKGRSQRVRLGTFTSEEILIKFGVPQGSVLGPVLFNIYLRSIYKYVQKIGFQILGYADDHQIAKKFKPSSQNIVLTYELKKCFYRIKDWMNNYFLQMNDMKTQMILFGPPKVLHDIQIRGINIEPDTTIRFISSVKNLGIYLDSHLTLNKQITEVKKKCFLTIRNIRKIRFLLSPDQVKTIVNSLVISCLDYCNSLYFGISEKLLLQLQLIQNACAKAVTGKYKYDHLDDDLKTLHWLNVRKRVIFKIGLLAYKSVNGLSPHYLQDLFQYCHHGHNLNLIVPSTKSLQKYGQRSFGVIGPRLLNNLPDYITKCDSVTSFKSTLKTFLFNLSDHEVKLLV